MIGTIIDMLLGPLGALVGGLAVVLAAWVKGRRDGRQEAARKALEGNLDTREKVDEVRIDDDVGVLRRKLHDYGRKP